MIFSLQKYQAGLLDARVFRNKQTLLAFIACTGLAVHPDFKRRGIATELYVFIEGCVKKIGGRLIILDAGSGEVNQYFYRKMGFIECGRVPKYYSEKKRYGYVL